MVTGLSGVRSPCNHRVINKIGRPRLPTNNNIFSTFSQRCISAVYIKLAYPKYINNKKYYVQSIYKKFTLNKFNFWSKDQLTKEKDKILIKDLISNKWKYKTKEVRLIYSREYIFFTNISEGRPFLLQCLTYHHHHHHHHLLAFFTAYFTDCVTAGC